MTAHDTTPRYCTECEQPADDAQWEDFAEWLRESAGYTHPVRLDQNRYIALSPKIFTTALVVGEIGDTFGIRDTWCYENAGAALQGLAAWLADPSLPEPPGWFRHPPTGRRVSRGPGEIDEHGHQVPAGTAYVRR